MLESENPLAIRSKKWITSALIDLMKEKPFNKITIQEIANKAELDRRTFYRNFSSKEDILSYHILRLSTEYSVALKEEKYLSLSIALRIFCETAYKHRDFILLLIENNLSVLLLNVFDEVLPAIHNMVQDKFSEITDLKNIEYAFSYNAGGFWNVLNKWFKEGTQLSPSQIAEIVANLIEKMFT